MKRAIMKLDRKLQRVAVMRVTALLIGFILVNVGGCGADFGISLAVSIMLALVGGILVIVAFIDAAYCHRYNEMVKRYHDAGYFQCWRPMDDLDLDLDFDPIASELME